MPNLTGPETATLIREFLKEKNIEQPIISGVTGASDQKSIDNCFMSGMN